MPGYFGDIWAAVKNLRRRQAVAAPAAAESTIRAADPPAPQTQEFGATGNEIYAGQILDREEYNPILRWPNLVRVVDEMRKSDPQVAATMRILKLPIMRARREIRPPAHGDNQDQAIADFCTWALLREQAMRITWDRVIRHLLLSLDFGFSPVELVWTVKAFDGRPVYAFDKLAPRLPKTLKAWKVNAYGELDTMVQYAPKGDTWRELEIPAGYLCVVVNEREGDNYNGVSILRPAYKPWYYLNQLEHIDMIRHHRFSAGLPVAQLTNNTKQTEGERRATETTLATIASSEASYVISPANMEFKIEFPSGGDSGMEKSLEYHAFAITKSILASFLNNQAEGLNSNRTRTMAGLFANLLEALSGEIDADITRQIVVRLCDQNFDMTGREYPSYVTSNINPVNMAEVSSTFKDLGAAGFITPDDDLERWLREMTGAPELPESFSRTTRIEQGLDPAAGAVAGDNVGDQPDGMDANMPIAASHTRTEIEDAILLRADTLTAGDHRITGRDGMVLAAAARIRARRRRVGAGERALTLADAGFVYQGRIFPREPTELERKLLALAEIPDTLDTAVEKYTADIVALRRAQLKRAAAWLASKKDLTGITPEQIPMSDAGDAFTITREVQDAIEQFGAQQVRHELIKQGAALELADAAIYRDTLVLAGDKPSARASLKGALVASARSFADWIVTEWRSDILDAGVRLSRTGLTGDELETELLKELDQRAEQGVLRFTKQKVNEAFGIGRAREAEVHKDVIARVVQSALLDHNTCKPCAAVDGAEMVYGSAQQKRLAPPYRNCAGKESCRCAQLFIYENPADRAGEGTRLRDNTIDIVAAVGRQIASNLHDAAHANGNGHHDTRTDVELDPMTGHIKSITKRRLVEGADDAD
jgi:hypothetical protein